MSLYKVKGAFQHPFVQESRQMAHPALTRAFLQAAATTTMRCQAERYTHPPTPVSPFLLAQPTYLQNGLRQLITCGQNLTTPKGVISHAPPQTKICSTWLQQTVLKDFQSTYTVCILHTRNQQHLWPASSTPYTAVSWRLVIPRCLLYIIKECIHPLVSNLTVSVRFIDDAKQVPNSISHAC